MITFPTKKECRRPKGGVATVFFLTKNRDGSNRPIGTRTAHLANLHKRADDPTRCDNRLTPLETETPPLVTLLTPVITAHRLENLQDDLSRRLLQNPLSCHPTCTFTRRCVAKISSPYKISGTNMFITLRDFVTQVFGDISCTYTL